MIESIERRDSARSSLRPLRSSHHREGYLSGSFQNMEVAAWMNLRQMEVLHVLLVFRCYRLAPGDWSGWARVRMGGAVGLSMWQYNVVFSPPGHGTLNGIAVSRTPIGS